MTTKNTHYNPTTAPYQNSLQLPTMPFHDQKHPRTERSSNARRKMCGDCGENFDRENEEKKKKRKKTTIQPQLPTISPYNSLQLPTTPYRTRARRTLYLSHPIQLSPTYALPTSTKRTAWMWRHGRGGGRSGWWGSSGGGRRSSGGSTVFDLSRCTWP